MHTVTSPPQASQGISGSVHGLAIAVVQAVPAGQPSGVQGVVE